jgi:hypothetical protein
MVRRLPICSLAVFAVALLAVSVRAQSSDDVAREVQRLRTQIEQERKAIAQDSAQQAQWRAQTKARHASMRSEAQRLARQRDSLREALDQSNRPKKPVAPPVTPAAARKKAFAEALAREIEKTLPLLSRELDRGAELADQWGRLAKGLRAGTEEPSEAMGRFLDDLSERIDVASRIATHPGTYTDAAGKAARGAFVAVGGTLEFFVSANGEQAALRMRGEPNLRELTDPVEIAALSRASRILAGEASPAWIQLPLGGGAP